MNTQEVIMMLEELLNRAQDTMPYRPNCTELNNVKPESFEFVIQSAIAALTIKKRGEKDDH